MPRCRDCKLYDIDGVKSKSGAILSSRVAKCLWVSMEVWPESAAGLYGNSRPRAGNMPPNDTHKCQRFIKRDT